jgi:hypothetical protein
MERIMYSDQKAFNMNDLRLSELCRIARYRYPSATERNTSDIPYDADGIALFEAIAAQLAHLPGDLRKRLISWCDLSAPSFPIPYIESLAVQLRETPPFIDLTADQMAQRVNVKKNERDALNLRSIGAIDFTKADRVAAKRKRDNERQALKRLERGAAQRVGNLSKSKPWESLGMSRASWFAKRKAGTLPVLDKSSDI